ncbi:MAG: hypothetical protein HZB68_03075 [Candidatus Aenigmarchaeota archaeon]|nr:hypothetical protein [Candidatus Aenigmarchaeota archaeon]
MEITDERKTMIEKRRSDANEKGITEKIKYVTNVLGKSGYDDDRNGVKSVESNGVIFEHIDVTGPVRGYYNRFKAIVDGSVVYNDRVGKNNGDGTRSWMEPSYFEAYIPSAKWENVLSALVDRALEIEDEKAINAARKELDTMRLQNSFMKSNFGA